MCENEAVLDEILATEYFSQYENIVRGGNKEKCIEKFSKACVKAGITDCDQGAAQTKVLLGRLNAIAQDNKYWRESIAAQVAEFRMRPVIYLFISSLVCVLLLHYS